MRRFAKKYPWLFQCALAALAGIAGCLGYWFVTLMKNDTFGSVEPYALFFSICVLGSILGMFLIYPLIITVYELYQLFTLKKPGAKKVRMAYHLHVIALAIMLQVMVVRIREYEPDPSRSSRIDSIPLLGWCNRVLQNAKLWPLAAFVLMWPLLGILIACLLLFGQAPDSLIQAWTKSSGFNLSQKVSPQNLYYDEHYLCTAAAGGHRKVVKPQRMGIRHGHEVIVNRQLCVANAFEQVLEERTPKFHRVVRNFYDRYGFPVAKLIRSRYAADLVYILMKPLEWFFVIVLYLTDVHPEDRIAMQYTGKTLQTLCRSPE